MNKYRNVSNTLIYRGRNSRHPNVYIPAFEGKLRTEIEKEKVSELTFEPTPLGSNRIFRYSIRRNHVPGILARHREHRLVCKERKKSSWLETVQE